MFSDYIRVSFKLKIRGVLNVSVKALIDKKHKFIHIKLNMIK